MRKFLVSLSVLALGLGGFAFAHSPRASAQARTTPVITGSVGASDDRNAFAITLSKATVIPGTYQLKITDFANLHNFDFCKGTSCTGSNTVHKTTIPGSGTVTWTIALGLGTYTYQCDAHSSTMKGHLKVQPTVQITSTTVNAAHTLVTVTAKASQSVHWTAFLFKGTTQLATTSSSVNSTTATLKLSRATPLQPGSYVVQVRGTVGGVSTNVKKTIQVS